MDYAAGLQESSAIGLLIGYAVAAIVITALALFLFRIRKSERAGTALAFNPIKLPVKIIICVVMGTRSPRFSKCWSTNPSCGSGSVWYSARSSSTAW